MFDRMAPLAEEKPRMAPLTIRIANIPALFSEGPDPEPVRAAPLRWGGVETVIEWMGFTSRRRNPAPHLPSPGGRRCPAERGG